MRERKIHPRSDVTKSVFTENFKIIFCVYGLNFIDFEGNFSKFPILSGSGEREMRERERKTHPRGEVAKI